MADARGEYWYFEPGVDANKITVPELRSILLKHGVGYPSSAKKPQLVALFNESVAPQAAQVQRSYARTKRTTRGIVDMPSSSNSTAEDVEDETLVAPTPATRRTARRTVRGATEDADDKVPAPRTKTPSRAVPAKHSRALEPEIDERPAARRTRKSVTPAVKEPTPDPEAWHHAGPESPFTQDNPFQSGSSPAIPDTKSRDKSRRRTLGAEVKQRRKSDAHRRRTAEPNAEQYDEGIVVPSRKTFDVEPSHTQDDEHDSTDAGEEFTPEAQLELVRERAKSGEVDILPPRRRKPSAKATGTLKAFSATLLLTTAAVFGGVWRQEKIDVGFCGIGRDATSLAGVDVPEWASDVLPQCEPCPPHAQCYRGLELTCDPDFIRQDHPLSFGGLVPLPPTCEPDNAKTRRVTAVANKAVEILREKRAQYECGEPDAEGNLIDTPEVAEEELKQTLASRTQKGMTDKEFNELFDRAFPETILRDEVVEAADATTGKRKLSSTSLAKLSLSCSIRRSVIQSFERHLLQIVIFFLLVASGSYGRYSYTTSRKMEARAKQLASEVFDRLANHAALSYQEPGAQVDRGVSMAQLRDDVLRNEFSSSRRQKLWQRVQKKVEFNSNVRAAVRTANSGDVARVWEWIGPVHLIEDGRSSGKRESGRFSVENTPSTASRSMMEKKSWDGGHPVY
ncbi:sister chromatid separation protein-like protein [Boeremia exigua]|uniref:sister chromatid separation protein-like protein n=1 Tax=Boeremia exigua TaxID=749465 RepID=UPI001E8DC36B|nr:sister chromatid separation protein-like protein [Boeremia exigua]KAH6643634.1 sister chromatid separation protein-like protein [Boeremia exigua]